MMVPGLIGHMYLLNILPCLGSKKKIRVPSLKPLEINSPMAQSLKKKILKSERWNPIWWDPKVLMILLCKNLIFGHFQVTF